MLATLKEYVAPLRPKTVLWFYFEGNDLRDPQIHKRLDILTRYVEGSFVQNLPERQRERDQALMNYVYQVGRTPPQEQKRRSLNIRHFTGFIKLSGLRARTGLSIDKTSEEAVSEANMALFRRILSQAKNHVATWGGRIYFIYLPDWDRYAQKEPAIYGQQRAKILSYVNRLGIPLIDVHPAFQSQTDPLSLFPFREPNHYNETGHRIVAEEVLKVPRLPSERTSNLNRQLGVVDERGT